MRKIMSIFKRFLFDDSVSGCLPDRVSKLTMKQFLIKRGFMLALGMFAAVSMVWGQSSQPAASGEEKSVEDSYLQDSIEIAIIREQSRSESWDGQMVALEYISEAIEGGNTSDEIRAALEYMGLEGIANITRENGRVVNNFPDVRVRAAGYLGELGTAEAKDTLMKMLLADNEPWVLSETIKSLAKIGINDDEETVRTIAWIIRRYDTIGPNDILAKSALEAFDTFARNNNGIKDYSTVQAIMRIRDGRYIRPVKEKAKEVLANIRKYSQNDSGKQQR
jgi:plasmid stability protein